MLQRIMLHCTDPSVIWNLPHIRASQLYHRNLHLKLMFPKGPIRLTSLLPCVSVGTIVGIWRETKCCLYREQTTGESPGGLMDWHLSVASVLCSWFFLLDVTSLKMHSLWFMGSSGFVWRLMCWTLLSLWASLCSTWLFEGMRTLTYCTYSQQWYNKKHMNN